ncbi:hypothetical protein OPV22_022711 [Ensete ventricosum]|uniref:Aminotransferase-like plant mobile domain-containing protein n=1 Tax=Ensete ventricosum TaxID=4639 RepID=A0AAV8QG99_ENSVE|nr:hypothetical protein OPV22_022711 [Ensete ventricosum]
MAILLFLVLVRDHCSQDVFIRYFMLLFIWESLMVRGERRERWLDFFFRQYILSEVERSSLWRCLCGSAVAATPFERIWHPKDPVLLWPSVVSAIASDLLVNRMRMYSIG